MAKRNNPKSVSDRKSHNTGEKPADLRRQLARADRDLITRLNERAKIASQLANAGVTGLLENLLSKVPSRNKGPLKTAALEAVFRELNSGCRELTDPIRVAFLGPEYSYSHMATVARFGQAAEPVPVGTIAAVFEEVERQHVNYGLVPIENSTDGRIVDTLDMFTRASVRICGEVPLRIHHNLLANCDRASIREVHSKPQALSQCREWLAKHLPQAKLVDAASTTMAAKTAAKQKYVAAVASRQAAVNFGLDTLAVNIEDNPANITRFSVIGVEPAKRTGNDKTSLMFKLSHQPGALADAMSIFKRNRLNMTWIESFPDKTSANEYLFFIELEGHQQDTRVRRAMESLQRKAVRIEVLGSFERIEPIG